LQIETYSEEHRAIQVFWQVVRDFTEDEKRKLLKFATSRSRPPLFGFKNLIPSFAIHNSGSEDRLPTSSTCLNLLKLPPICDYDLMKSKILCAIEAEAGFDLS
jgi:ubiquitin-protein ligase E3 C